jgi:hypothetical protein
VETVFKQAVLVSKRHGCPPSYGNEGNLVKEDRDMNGG